MSLSIVSIVVGAVVATSLVVTLAFCVDHGAPRELIQRLDDVAIDLAPYFVLVGGVMLVHRLTHGASVKISKSLHWNITDSIFGIEGAFVAQLQAITPKALVPVFSGFYMFGFTYVVATPVVLYLLVSSIRPLKELLVAYSLNNAIGALLYTLFIAYGPRIRLDGRIDGLLYEWFPQTQQLTSAVSANTNVFPSLHTSLSVVVLLFAWRQRHSQPRWFGIASVVTPGIVMSTMVLGIHWLTDVVAGIVLAYGSVVAAGRIVPVVDTWWSGVVGEPTTGARASSDPADD